MRAVWRQPFDGRDLLADRGRRRQLARLHRLAVDMDRAGAAARDAASVFGAGEADIVAQDPKQRGLRLDIHRLGLAVDVQGELHGAFPFASSAASCASRGPCQGALRRITNTTPGHE